MPIATFKAPRVSPENDEDLKRSVERSMVELEGAINILQDGIDNYYHVIPPPNITAFKKVLVHYDHAIVSPGWGDALPALPALPPEGGAAVYIWYVAPVPARMVNHAAIDLDGQWIKIYDLPIV